MSKKSYRLKTKIKLEQEGKEEQDKNFQKSNIKITKALSREIKFTLVMILAICILLLTGTYSIFSITNKSEEYNSITVGTLNVSFLQDSEDILNLNGAYPTIDTEGEKLDPYNFKITNNGTLTASYKIKLVNDNDIISEDKCGSNLLPLSMLKVKINQENPFILADKEENLYVIAEDTILPNETKEYNIRIWIKDTAGNEVLGKHYHGKIVVDSVNLSTN